jgi:uncharacterized membrane protein
MRKNKMLLETSKNIGGIGAILMFAGVLPYINYFGIIEIIGAILVLVALHGFGSNYKEEGIFNNALYSIITGIIGVVSAIAIGIAIVLPNIRDFLMTIFPSWDGDWSTLSSLSGMIPDTSNIGFADVIPFIVAAMVVFVILWIFAIIAAFFMRRSLKQLSAKSNVGLFGTTGILILVGAVIPILGLLLIWVALLLLAIAFFSVRTAPAQSPTPVTTQTQV